MKNKINSYFNSSISKVFFFFLIHFFSGCITHFDHLFSSIADSPYLTFWLRFQIWTIMQHWQYGHFYCIYFRVVCQFLFTALQMIHCFQVIIISYCVVINQHYILAIHDRSNQNHEKFPIRQKHDCHALEYYYFKKACKCFRGPPCEVLWLCLNHVWLRFPLCPTPFD